MARPAREGDALDKKQPRDATNVRGNDRLDTQPMPQYTTSHDDLNEVSARLMSLTMTRRQINSDLQILRQRFKAANAAIAEASIRLLRATDPAEVFQWTLEKNQRLATSRAYLRSIKELEAGARRAAGNASALRATWFRAHAQRARCRGPVPLRVNRHVRSSRRVVRVAGPRKPTSTADPDGEPDSRRASRSSTGGVA